MMDIDAELHPALAAALAALQGQDGSITEPRVRSAETADFPSDKVVDWPLSRFATSGQCREIYSKILDEVIVLAADNADLPDFGDTVVYRAAEAQLLVGLSPDEIRAFHEVKVFFDGIIERATPNESQIDAAEVLGTEEGPE